MAAVLCQSLAAWRRHSCPRAVASAFAFALVGAQHAVPGEHTWLLVRRPPPPNRRAALRSRHSPLEVWTCIRRPRYYRNAPPARVRGVASNNPGVAELADAHDSKSCGRKAVMVRPHSPGPKVHTHRRRLFFTPTGTCALPPLKFKISSVSSD